MEKTRDYYLGLDIGTDSVGYAVTDPDYGLLKFKGEPMWGVHLFEGGNDAAERRLHRTNRRRIDRRQQRVALVSELFAEEIGKTDPYFFHRRRESALYGEDNHHGTHLFCGGGLTDQQYHEKYPTIHHLILDLMTDKAPHDIRLVYMACAWLVAHRGHFLFDIAPDRMDKLLDFDTVYSDFCQYLVDQSCTIPWDPSVAAEDIFDITLYSVCRIMSIWIFRTPYPSYRLICGTGVKGTHRHCETIDTMEDSIPHLLIVGFVACRNT